MGDNSHDATPLKRIKTENPLDELMLRVPTSSRPSLSPQPGSGGPESPMTTMSPTNLDRLANLAAQRSETKSGIPFPARIDNATLHAAVSQGSPSSSSLPLSLQRLQAMRQQQQQQQQQQQHSSQHQPQQLPQQQQQQQHQSHLSRFSPLPAGQNQSSAQSQSTPQPSQGPASISNPQGSSYDQLIDVMGYSGVDLRAEEAFIQQNGAHWDDAHAASVINSAGLAHALYLNVYPLSSMVHRIAKQYGLKVDAATLDYLSVATRMRFRNLLESMIRASRHRAWSSHQRNPPMYSELLPDGSQKAMYHEEMLSNPMKQLAGIEKAERIEEGNWRRMRIEREENEAAAMEAGGDDATPKNKKRSSTSSRNLSEDVRKRLADSTAMRHLGANNVTSKYSWLQSPATRTPSRVRETGEQQSHQQQAESTSSPKTNSSLPKPKFAPSAGLRAPAAQAAHAGAWSDVAMRQAAKREQERIARARVTMHDALAALEREQAGGAGHGAGRRALYLAQAYGGSRGFS